VSGLIDRITENDKVEFELEEGPKGMSAINVKKID
jgi:cold shock CspA family protein